jgi:hypothetical protein
LKLEACAAPYLVARIPWRVHAVRSDVIVIHAKGDRTPLAPKATLNGTCHRVIVVDELLVRSSCSEHVRVFVLEEAVRPGKVREGAFRKRWTSMSGPRSCPARWWVQALLGWCKRECGVVPWPAVIARKGSVLYRSGKVVPPPTI